MCLKSEEEKHIHEGEPRGVKGKHNFILMSNKTNPQPPRNSVFSKVVNSGLLWAGSKTARCLKKNKRTQHDLGWGRVVRTGNDHWWFCAHSEMFGLFKLFDSNILKGERARAHSRGDGRNRVWWQWAQGMTLFTFEPPKAFIFTSTSSRVSLYISLSRESHKTTKCIFSRHSS